MRSDLSISSASRQERLLTTGRKSGARERKSRRAVGLPVVTLPIVGGIQVSLKTDS